ncbi:MAG: P-loop NTPase [Thermoplasmatota archaeon]
MSRPIDSGHGPTTPSAQPTLEMAILEALKVVKDPDLGRDIVTLGFVKNLAVHDGHVSVDLDLTTPACPVKDKLRDETIAAASSVPGVHDVKVKLTAHIPIRKTVDASGALADVRSLVAIASGKGGVGKSTVTANLALALASEGAHVGVLDADVYGPSIPGMLGLTNVDMNIEKRVSAGGRMVPAESHGIKVMSMAFLANKDTPVIWRGPMASKLIQQFLSGVEWGELDYLLIDLPPGTGDIQLTLSQTAPLTGAVIVTTPQDVARSIAERGLRMFQQVNVPILGIVENMSAFICPDCGGRHAIFRAGGGAKAASEFGVPFLGDIPLEGAVAEAGDAGLPVVARTPHSPAAESYRAIAGELARKISIVLHETSSAGVHPTEAKPLSRTEFSIGWSDGHASRYVMRELRGECPCALCVDENTGRRKVTSADVPADVRILSAEPVGRYALRFIWSDGHTTGIYSFRRLLELCECDRCVGMRSKVPSAA